MKIISLDHIHIYCSDLQASTHFYTQHFQAQELMRNENIHNQPRIFLTLGQLPLVLSPFPPDITPKDPPPPGDGAYTHGSGIAHFGLRVPNVKQATQELTHAGIQFLSQPITEPTGLTYTYLAAPDGVVIELTQYGSRTQPE